MTGNLIEETLQYKGRYKGHLINCMCLTIPR